MLLVECVKPEHLRRVLVNGRVEEAPIASVGVRLRDDPLDVFGQRKEGSRAVESWVEKIL